MSIADMDNPTRITDNSNHVGSGSAYPLLASETERRRLDFQHGVFKRLFDDQLLPSQLDLQAGDKILDSGTGTGVWALDVCETISSDVSIEGFDIQPRMFPNNPPKNVSFSVHSVLALPEPEWTNQFTLIHQRLLFGGLRLSEWKQAFSQMYRVLKVGGWIRLEEVDMIPKLSSGENLASHMPENHRMLIAIADYFHQHDLIHECSTILPDLIATAGFGDISTDSRRLILGPGDSGHDGRAALISVYRAMKPLVVDRIFGKDKAPQSDEDYEKLLLLMENEMIEHDVYMTTVAFTARKLE